MRWAGTGVLPAPLHPPPPPPSQASRSVLSPIPTADSGLSDAVTPSRPPSVSPMHGSSARSPHVESVEPATRPPRAVHSIDAMQRGRAYRPALHPAPARSHHGSARVAAHLRQNIEKDSAHTVQAASGR